MRNPVALALFLIAVALQWIAPARGAPRPALVDSVSGGAVPAGDAFDTSAHAPPRHPFGPARRWIPRWMQDPVGKRMHHVVNEVVALLGLAWYLARARRLVDAGWSGAGPTVRGNAFLLQYLAVATWAIAYALRSTGNDGGYVDEGFTCANSMLLLAMAVTLVARLHGWFALGVTVASAAVLTLALTVPFSAPVSWTTIEQCGAVTGEFCVGVAVVALVWATPRKRLALACGLTGVAYAMLQGHSVELKELHPVAFFYGAGLLKIAWIIVVLQMLERVPLGEPAAAPRPRPRVSADRPAPRPRKPRRPKA